MCEAKDVPWEFLEWLGKLGGGVDGAETEGQDTLLRIPAKPSLQ